MSIYIYEIGLPHEDIEPLKCEIYADGTVLFIREPDDFIEVKAVEVENHGRLGDLDKLEKDLRLCAKYQTGDRQQGILGCCETIRLTKTIIPSDKKP